MLKLPVSSIRGLQERHERSASVPSTFTPQAPYTYMRAALYTTVSRLQSWPYLLVLFYHASPQTRIFCACMPSRLLWLWWCCNNSPSFLNLQASNAYLCNCVRALNALNAINAHLLTCARAGCHGHQPLVLVSWSGAHRHAIARAAGAACAWGGEHITACRSRHSRCLARSCRTREESVGGCRERGRLSGLNLRGTGVTRVSVLTEV